jgi:hypothetical protein
MNKILKGGNIDNHYLQLQTFLSMVILGYFGVKVVYGIFFNFYPEKYYYRNIDINTSESEEESLNTKNVVMNAYMPGLWNTEITDFVVTVILSLIIYIYTNMASRTMIDDNGNLNSGLLFGYIIGLGFPPFMKTIAPLLAVNEDNNLGRTVLNCLSIALFIILLVIVVITNYISVNNDFKNTMSYTTFIAVLFLLIFGLFVSRKKQQTVGPIAYYFSDKENCKTKKNKYIMSSGDVIKITPVFCTFVLLLLFSYDPKDAGWKYMYILFYGLFLGVFISGISYYGIEYFLVKQPIKQCDSASECNTIKDSDDYNDTMSEDLEQVNENKKSFNVIKLIMIIALIIVMGYLLINNMRK